MEKDPDQANNNRTGMIAANAKKTRVWNFPGDIGVKPKARGSVIGVIIGKAYRDWAVTRS
jgi:hypothetical protein